MQSDWVHPNHADAGHVLRLQVHDFDESGSITLHFDLNCTVFNDQLRTIIPHHFLKLLDAFIADNSTEIARHSLKVKSSDDAIDLEEQSDFNYEYKNVVELFENNAKNFPDSLAIEANDEPLSYKVVNSKANQLARYLISKGLKKEDRVGVYLKRSPDLIVSVLAILKAGAVFIPMDTTYSGIRTSDMLEDSQVSFVITNSSLQKSLCEIDALYIGLDDIVLQINKLDETNLQLELENHELSYIMYTSGSTGKPKGVMISNNNLSHYLQWAQHEYGADQSTRAPLFTAIGFDLTITSLFLPLISGGTVVVYEEPDSGPDLSIFTVLEDNSTSFIKLTPSHLALLGDKNFSDSLLKVMVVGGEDLKYELAKSIQLRFGESLELHNEYGPTESTVGCVVHQFTENNNESISVPIGKPIANTQVYVLDEFLNQVPSGVSGELYVSGIGLARGYWNQPELSVANFVPNPFTNDGTMYKTGDLVRENSKGDLVYLGRMDEQVKISGRRIELGEIESALNTHPEIETSIVELRTRIKAVRSNEVKNCSKCGLPSNYPNIEFDEQDVCSLCTSFDGYQSRVSKYFKTPADFKKHFDDLPGRSGNSYVVRIVPMFWRNWWKWV